MRTRHRSCPWPVFALAGLVIAAALLTVGSGEAANIEAVEGKRYKLTRKHGPWMIMVASFREPPKEARTEGMTPMQAADELVYELRKEGIPAYTFSQRQVTDRVKARDRFGRRRARPYVAQRRSVCVLAGNYSAAKDHIAQRTLEYVKKFHPDFLRDVEKKVKTGGGLIQRLKNGGIYRKTPGRPGPLSGAFLTINPMLTPEEARRRERDPLLVKLNSGGEYSLLDNPGKYTLVVATSYVESTTAAAGSNKFRKALQKFKPGDDLDDSALEAWQLAKTLREGRVPIRGELGVAQRNFEAYVFHDRYRSIVTVGSFDSPEDPRIAKLKELFGAKVRKNPNTGKDVTVAEVVTLPDPKNENAPLKTWIFDPQPRLIEVPRISR